MRFRRIVGLSLLCAGVYLGYEQYRHPVPIVTRLRLAGAKVLVNDLKDLQQGSPEYLEQANAAYENIHDDILDLVEHDIKDIKKCYHRLNSLQVALVNYWQATQRDKQVFEDLTFLIQSYREKMEEPDSSRDAGFWQLAYHLRLAELLYVKYNVALYMSGQNQMAKQILQEVESEFDKINVTDSVDEAMVRTIVLFKAHIYHSQALDFEDERNLQKALELGEISLELFDSVCKDQPSKERAIARQTLARINHDVGNIEASGNLFRRSISEMVQLMELNPHENLIHFIEEMYLVLIFSAIVLRKDVKAAKQEELEFKNLLIRFFPDQDVDEWFAAFLKNSEEIQHLRNRTGRGQ